MISDITVKFTIKQHGKKSLSLSIGHKKKDFVKNRHRKFFFLPYVCVIMFQYVKKIMTQAYMEVIKRVAY